MTQKKFLEELGKRYLNNVEISRVKNADYAEEGDPFKNFRACSIYGVTPEHGLIVRMSDKLTRAANLLTRDNQVKDESLQDTLADLANYAMILAIYIDEKRTNRKTE